MGYLEYRIHPSVGIARMGDSTTHFFVGRETPKSARNPANPWIRTIPSATSPSVPVDQETKDPTTTVDPMTSVDPMTPVGPTPTPSYFFRDPTDHIAKQAARFRVFGYYYEQIGGKKANHPDEVWEVTAAQYEMTWTVHIANTKAGKPPIPKEGEARATLSTETAPDFTTPKPLKPRDRLALGSAVLDAAGSSRGTLLVLGSSGDTDDKGDVNYKPNDFRAGDDGIWPGWEDDAGDGPVTVEVRPRSGNSHGRKKEAEGGQVCYFAAWVVVGSPDFGADTTQIVSLFDVAMDRAQARSDQEPPRPGEVPEEPRGREVVRAYVNHDHYRERPNRTLDIDPLLQSYLDLPHVSVDAAESRTSRPHPRATIEQLRATPKLIFDRLGKPLSALYEPENMFTGKKPWSLGLRWSGRTMPLVRMLALPRLKYHWMEQWSLGDVDLEQWLPQTRPPSDLERPRLLDEAHMGSMCGGSFWPGIEVGREAARYQNWRAEFGARRGHMDVRYYGEAGSMTHDLCVPWQWDFESCAGDRARPRKSAGTEFWPSSRPEETRRAGDAGGSEARTWGHDQRTPPVPGTKPRLKRRPAPVLDMIHEWMSLGFMRRQPDGALREVDRTNT